MSLTRSIESLETAMFNPNRETIAAIDNILRGLRHELSTLATVLLLEVEQLEQDADQRNGDLKSHINELRHDMGELYRLIVRLRTFPSADFSPTPVDVVRSVDEAIAQAAPLAENVGVRVYTHLPHTSHWVVGSEKDLTQIFYALIENALEATASTESTQPIEISVRTGNHVVTLVVADRGPGLAHDIVRNGTFLKPGYTTKHQDGTARGLGMGLLAAYAVAELHGGTFRLQPRQKGGTLAIFTLPTISASEHLIGDLNLNWNTTADLEARHDLDEFGATGT